MAYSASPSAMSPSQHSISDSSDSEAQSALTDPRQHTSAPRRNQHANARRGGDTGMGSSVSRQGSPDGDDIDPALEDSVTCEWDGCGIVFTHLPTLIDHIHNDHIGVHKSNYTCEWASCSRRGLAQTSRFALISHIRSHTGEKPFTCLRPECDKSFTRSDALAKHMRLQHNIEPPAPGRGGSRKRKRAGADDPSSAPSSAPMTRSHSGSHLHQQPAYAPGIDAPHMQLRSSSRHAPPADIPGSTGFGQFKVDTLTPSEYDEGLGHDNGYFYARNGHVRPPFAQGGPQHNSYDTMMPPSPPLYPPPAPPSPPGSPPPLSLIPGHLLAHYDENTQTIFGRTPYQVLYLLTKAKHQCALRRREELLEELQMVREDRYRAVEDKEKALDDVVRAVGGPDAEQFIAPIPPFPSMYPHPPEEVMDAQPDANGNGY